MVYAPTEGLSRGEESKHNVDEAIAAGPAIMTYAQNALELSAMLRSEPVLREAMMDIGSRLEAPQNIDDTALSWARRGFTPSRIRQMMADVQQRFGVTDRSRAVIRQWILRSILPSVASATATYVLQQAYAVYRRGKGEIINVDEAIRYREIIEAAEAVDGQDDDDGNNTGRPSSAGVFSSGLAERAKKAQFMRGEFESLNGSVLNIPSTDAPLGVVDSVIPKSSPTLPPTGPIHSLGPSGAIFTPDLQGDRLSERRSQKAANVLRTTIPVPPIISSISPAQSYMALERIPPPPPPPTPSVPAQTTKRKADFITPEQDFLMASQVTATYDTNNVPALPGGVTGPTSQRWREYEAPYQGYNVPLTDAPNLVGIGFDAETMERKMAEEGNEKSEPATPMGMEHAQPPGAEPLTPTPVNTANETNPAVANKGKPQTKQPAAELPPPHIRY